MREVPDIVDWAESEAGFYLPETKRPIVLADHQKAILRHLFTPDSNGKYPYETILYSCPKKGGKTTLAAMVALWFSLFLEAPNEIYILANTLEQSIARSFDDLAGAIRLNPILRKRTNVRAKDIALDNGTTIQALSSDYAGAAGSRHGLTVWDELWAYTSEASQRLFDELTPVPTRKNSIRFIVTYAGFEGESTLLEGLHKRGMAGTPVPELAHIENGRGEPACRADGRTFCYWDHELKVHPGLTISPEEYRAQQRLDLRPGAFARLHDNLWASSISRFVEKEQWRACYDAELTALSTKGGRKAYFGLDASTSKDLTSLVGVVFNSELNRTEIVYVKVWRPKKDDRRKGKLTIDLNLVEDEILRLHQLGVVKEIILDPYQLHSMLLRLSSHGVKISEMPQNEQRVESDTALYDAIIGKTIKHFDDPVLNEHMQNAVAVERPRGIRISKSKTTKKIDCVIALSMAHFGAAEKQAPSWDSIKGLGYTGIKSRWSIGHKEPIGAPDWFRQGHEDVRPRSKWR